jgi:hypothetical protein
MHGMLGLIPSTTKKKKKLRKVNEKNLLAKMIMRFNYK